MPLIVWATLASGTALMIRERIGGHPMWLLLFVALLLLGPVAVGVHAVSAWVLAVRVHPELGLCFRNGRRIPWDSLRAVSHRPSVLDVDVVPGGRRIDRALEDPSPGCDEAVFWLSGLKVVWVLLYYLLLPALVALSPWPSRVRLSLKDGSDLDLRDLDDDRLFVKLAKIGLSGHPKRTARIERALREAA